MLIKNKYSKLIVLITMLLFVVGFTACIKNDNYAGPGETITGYIIDSVTGKALQADNNETRIELLETSWTATTPTPDPYFFTNDTGYYHNNQIFKAVYNVNVNGAFVPLNHKLWPAPNTDVTNTSPTITISGVVTQNFTVDPILEIQWVTPPVLDATDNTIEATIIVTRGTTNALFQNPMKALNFYACEVPYPGDGNYDSRYSRVKTTFPNNETVVVGGVTKPNVFVLGQPYVVKTSGTITSRTWWFRVGACTTVGLPTGTPYNYSTIQKLVIP
jgi:hypothetical protein